MPFTFEKDSLFRVGIWEEYETHAIMVRYVRGRDLIQVKIYGHCSCHDSENAVFGGDHSHAVDERRVSRIAWDWTGTSSEFENLARAKLDFAMPKRKVSRDDYNGRVVLKVYSTFLRWLAAGKPGWKNRKVHVDVRGSRAKSARPRHARSATIDRS